LHRSIGENYVDYLKPEYALVSVFDVINVLEGNVIARAAIGMIDSDQSMVTLSKRNVVIGVR
jgi:hypothetical protein